MDADKDYGTSVYELYSDCHGQITSCIGKLQMYILCCHLSKKSTITFGNSALRFASFWYELLSNILS